MVAHRAAHGRTDLPLTTDGRAARRRRRAAARHDCAADRPPALVASQPAHPGAAHRGARRPVASASSTEDLAEWDYGDYEGLTTPQIRETVPGWTVWTHPCPGGETAAQVGARATAVLERARAALSDGDVILVGHGHFSRVLVATLARPAAPTGASTSRLDAAADHGARRRARACHRSSGSNVPPAWSGGCRSARCAVSASPMWTPWSGWCTSWPSTSARRTSAT